MWSISINSFGTMRLVGEHIETGGIDRAVFQRLDQCRLIDHRAARHIDQNAARTKRLEHLGIDHILVLAPPGTITISVSTSRAMSISFG